MLYNNNNNNNNNNEKVLRETQTLYVGCSKAEPNIFAPPLTEPLPGVAGRPKFHQLDMVTFTYKPTLVSIDARSFKLSW